MVDLATLAYNIVTTSLVAGTAALRAHAAAAGTAAQTAAGFQAAMDRSVNSVGGFRNAMSSLSPIIMAVNGALAAGAIVRYADSWNRMIGRLGAAHVPLERIAVIQDEIADIAVRSRSPLEAVGNLYSRMSRSAHILGLSQSEVGETTELLSKALVNSGATAQETSSSLIQFSQAMQKGKLNGDELRSMLEQMPPVVEAISREFGVGIGQLQKMGAQGKLNMDRVIRAVLNSRDEIEAAFKNLPMTVSAAWTNLITRVEQWVGKANNASGVTKHLTDLMGTLADNIDRVMRALEVLGGVLATLSAARLVASLAAIGPAGWVIAGLTAVIGLMYTFRDASIEVGGSWVQMGDMIAGVVAEIKSHLAALDNSGTDTAANKASEKAVWLITKGLEGAWEMTKAAINGIISLSVGAVNLIVQGWAPFKDKMHDIWRGVEQIAVNVVNGIITAFENGFNWIISKLNDIIAAANAHLPLLLQFDKVGPANFGRVELSKDDYQRSGKDLGDTAGQAFFGAFRDYVGAAGQEFNKLVDNAEKRAVGFAHDRLMSNILGGTTNRTGWDVRAKGKPDPSLTTSTGGSTRKNEFERDLVSLQKQTEALHDQIATYGMAAGAVARYHAEMELRNAAAREGITLTEKDNARIEAMADAYGRAVEELERLNNTKEAAAFIGQTLFDAAKGAESLSDALNKVTSALIDAVLQATLLGQGPLAGLFGTKQSGGALTSIFSTLIGGLVGGGGGVLAGGTPLGQGGIGGRVTAHSGGIIGQTQFPLRYLHDAYFENAPRFGRGGLVGGEVPVVAHQGEIIGWPNQLAKAFGGPKIEINNYAGVEIQERRGRGPDGEKMILDLVRGGMASGKFDDAMRGRYNQRPRKGTS